MPRRGESTALDSRFGCGISASNAAARWGAAVPLVAREDFKQRARVGTGVIDALRSSRWPPRRSTARRTTTPRCDADRTSQYTFPLCDADRTSQYTFPLCPSGAFLYLIHDFPACASDPHHTQRLIHMRIEGQIDRHEPPAEWYRHKGLAERGAGCAVTAPRSRLQTARNRRWRGLRRDRLDAAARVDGLRERGQREGRAANLDRASNARQVEFVSLA
jgi:hypothetical protein